MNDATRIDLHMHSTASDGTDSPETLLARVREAGIGVFSVTDHDGIACSRTIPALLRPGDPIFLPGVEFSCEDELGKYHILGYGYDPDAVPIREAVERGHRLRMEKFNARLDYLQTRLGSPFPAEAVEALRAQDNPGKPHLANLLVQLGRAESKEQAIRDILNGIKTPGASHLRPEEAIRGILGAGGIPVLAHPCFGSGDQLILGDELEQRVLRLRALGLQGLEAYYSGFSQENRERVLALARRCDLYVTAGSDYHGKNKPVALGDTGLTPDSPRPAGLLRFLRDAMPQS